MKRKTFIKICGIRNIQDARYAISAGADALGFIAYPQSPRYITPTDVKAICNELPSDKIRKVGVFVNATLPIIQQYLTAGINTIQLHGKENADFANKCAELAEVWKAINPQFEDCILQYAKYPAQKFLIDAFHKTLPGGTGQRVNSELAKFAIKNLPAPVILAGGLNPANFVESLKDIQPYGLDFNSGVELSPGIKDHHKIQQIFDVL